MKTIVEKYSIGLRAIEILLFLLLFQGAFSLVFAAIEMLTGLVSGSLPSMAGLTVADERDRL